MPQVFDSLNQKAPLVILPISGASAGWTNSNTNNIDAMEKRHLTARQQQAQQNLRAIWDAKKKELGLTQEIAADLLGWSSQGSVASYLNGRIPLNTDAIAKFSRLLQVDPLEIDPGFDQVLSTNLDEASPEGGLVLPLPVHVRQLIRLIEKHARDGALNKEHTAVLKSSLELMVGHKK